MKIKEVTYGHAVFTLLEKLDAMLWEVSTGCRKTHSDTCHSLWISDVISSVLLLMNRKERMVMNTSKTTCTTISAPLPLEPGTYRLTEDVKNPSPDRRCNQSRVTNWESWSVWPKGMEFIVDMESSTNMINSGMNRIYPHGGYYKAGRMDSRFPALVVCLEPAEETPSKFLARYAGGSGAGQVALCVLDKMNIPLGDIKKALEEIEAEEEMMP